MSVICALHSSYMTKFVLLPIALSFLLAACNSTPNAISDPPVGTNPPIVVSPPTINTYTSLDATIDFTKGANANLFQNASGTPFYLTKRIIDAATGTSTILAKTTLTTDGHARLTLPDATAITPFLDQITPTKEGATAPGCTVSNYSVSPTTFKTVMAEEVVKTGEATFSYSGYIGLSSITADGAEGRNLLYVDQDVTFNLTVDCLGAGREDREVTTLNLYKGWNVINNVTTQTGTADMPIYTHVSTTEKVTSGTVSLLLWTSFQTEAPRP